MRTIVELPDEQLEALGNIGLQEKASRLPDAIIRATAQELGRILVARNTKDFSEKDAGIRVPYKV